MIIQELNLKKLKSSTGKKFLILKLSKYFSKDFLLLPKLTPSVTLTLTKTKSLFQEYLFTVIGVPAHRGRGNICCCSFDILSEKIFDLLNKYENLTAKNFF